MNLEKMLEIILKALICKLLYIKYLLNRQRNKVRDSNRKNNLNEEENFLHERNNKNVIFCL